MYHLPTVVLVGLFACCGLTLGACNRHATTPHGTLERFTREVEGKAYKKAYRLLAEPYRRRVSLAEFTEYLEQNPGEVVAFAQRLDGSNQHTRITAEVPYADGETLKLVYESGAWRIDGDTLHFYDQSTPRLALRSFIRAMRRKRYDVVLMFVPERDKQGMTPENMKLAWEGEGAEEVERLLASLEANLDAPIEEIGEHATMPYGEGSRVEFVREGDDWKIEDPE